MRASYPSEKFREIAYFPPTVGFRGTTEPLSMNKNAAIEAERFKLFISSVRDYAIYTLSPEGIVSSWNAGAERFKGYTEEEILGQHYSSFYTNEDRDQGRPAEVLRIASGGKFEEEGWRVRKDGVKFWASVVMEPIRDEHGDLIGFTTITRDITDRIKSQEALHASEEQFRLLIQGVTDYAIYLLSPEGIVTNWNAGAERIKGYLSDEIVGKHFSHFYTEEDQQAGLPQRALATAAREGRFEREGWRLRKDGSRFWAHVIIDPVHDRMGNLIGFAKITRDVTERRQAEEELARAKEALFQSQKLEAIGKLTGGISHDFNNLLNVIINGIQILRMGVDRAAQIKTIDTMERAAQRGSTLTQQLLAFARQQPLQPERLDINRVLYTFEAVLRRAVPNSITLQLQLAPSLPKVMIDEAQLEAAVLNLVVNARDAIEDSGAIEVITELDNGDSSNGSREPRVLIRVKDNGAGMSEEVLKRAVEPFFTTKPVGKGSGLGLSQVFGLAGQSGGELSISSNVGQGTCITLSLPASDVRDAAHRTIGKVLVVDDQPEVLEMTAQLFDSLGYEVSSANSGEDALRVLQCDPSIDILFSDVVMPGMNGLELATNARTQFPRLKVILASGFMTPNLREQQHCAGLGQLPLLVKPFSLADVVRQLKAVQA